MSLTKSKAGQTEEIFLKTCIEADAPIPGIEGDPNLEPSDPPTSATTPSNPSTTPSDSGNNTKSYRSIPSAPSSSDNFAKIPFRSFQGKAKTSVIGCASI